MHAKTRNTLLALSIPTDLIDRIAIHDHTLTNLRSFSPSQLLGFYATGDADLIAEKIKRQPIDDDVLAGVLATAGGACALCADGNTAKPYQIHHIDPYAATQDNSEDNLLLVCPTHHVVIHTSRMPGEMQKAKRTAWAAVVDLARAYSGRGLPFPYGAFEPIFYGGVPNVAAVLSLIAPSPATAALLATHELGIECGRRLAAQRFLLLVGRSGSGKTTLATGVAGLPSAHGARVYRYRRTSESRARDALAEVLTFVGTAVSPCVLILDDVNSWASPADIEVLSQAVSTNVGMIATWTTGRLGDDAATELHALPSRIRLDWQSIRPALVALLMEHEHEVVNELRPYRRDDGETVGFNPPDRTLHSLLTRYEKAPTVWQFLFLLRGGWGFIRDDFAKLVTDDRADLPVLHAAIEQIADVERPVDLDETMRAVESVSHTIGLPAPTISWIEGVFSELVARRLMVKARTAYTTVHRDWARALICTALTDPRTRDEATSLLLSTFNIQKRQPRRLMILWSWLWNDRSGGKFAWDWADRQTPADWSELVGAAAAEGLVDLAMVADRLHTLFPSDGWTKVVGDAFEAHETVIANLVHGSGQDLWWSLRELFMALQHARPSLAKRIISGWDPHRFGTLLALTHPDHFDSIWWLVSGVRQICPEWCDSVGKSLDMLRIYDTLGTVRRGDVAAVQKCQDVLSRLGVPLTRKMVHILAERMGQALTGALISEIQLDFEAPFWLEFYPAEAMIIVVVLDPDQLAEELAAASPRHWGNLLALSGFARRAGSDFGERLVNALGLRILANAARHARTSPHQLRLLLWQLCYGSPAIRESLAAALFDTVADAYTVAVHEREQLLNAYCTLSPVYGKQLSALVNVEAPESDTFRGLNTPWFDALPNGGELRSRLEAMDRDLGEYDVEALFHGDDRGVVLAAAHSVNIGEVRDATEADESVDGR